MNEGISASAPADMEAGAPGGGEVGGAHFKSLLHSLPLPVFVQDADGNILDCNEQLASFLRRPRQDLLGRPLAGFVDQEFATALAALDTDVSEKGAESSLELRRNEDDGTRYYLLTKAPLQFENGAGTGLCGMVRDITAQRLAEQRMGQGEAMLLEITRHLDYALWIAEFDTAGAFRIVRVNQAFERLAGISVEQLRSNPLALLDGVHRDDRKKVLSAFTSPKFLKKGELNIHFRMVGKDDSVRYIWARSHKTAERQGLVRMVGMAEDVTLLARSEERRILARNECVLSQRKLTAIFRSISDCILTVDKNMRVIEANPSAIELFNSRGQALAVGETLTDSQSPCHSRMVKALRRSIQTLEPVSSFVTDCSAPGQKSLVLDISTSPLLDHQGKYAGAILVARDMTTLSTLDKRLHEETRYPGLVADSPAMRHLLLQTEELAPLDTTVLILGETGVGKERLAGLLHELGPRAARPMVTVNCAALRDSLLESELFGHARGAFTGAVKDKMGRVQAAEGGTLFLDEIADIPLPMQTKLLRLLEQKEYERVGDVRTRKADVRFVAATNARLQDKVRTGEFRADLYHRLNVVTLRIPPLRDRIEDLVPLVTLFLEQINKRHSLKVAGISLDVLSILERYPWPGNVRELKNSIEHACIQCKRGVIGPEHLPQQIAASDACKSLDCDKPAHGAPREHGRDEVLRALEAARGNKAKAARMLGVERTKFYRLLRNLDLS